MQTFGPAGPERDPGPDAIAKLIRTRRLERGWSLAELAKRVGLRAPSFIHHIENGDKAPSEEIAARLARALGEDEEMFRAWARVRGGTDLQTALDSAAMLEEMLQADLAFDVPAEIAPMISRTDRLGRKAPRFSGVRSPVDLYGSEPAFRALIPVVRGGMDPGAGPGVENVEERVRLDARTLRTQPELFRRVMRLQNPFAYRLTERSTRRARALLPSGHVAILTRDVLPLEPGEVYAVRTGDGVELGFIRWNGEQLLLLSSTPDAGDFRAFEVRDEAALAARVAGMVSLVVPPAALVR